MKSTMTMEHAKLDGNADQEKNSASSSSKIFEKVGESPFTIYGDEEEGYILLMGKYRLTEKMSLRDIKEESKRVSWDRITQVIMAITETINEEKKQTKEN